MERILFQKMTTGAFKRTILFYLGFFLSKDKANFLRRKKIFHSIGENVLWATYIIPNEPYLVSIGNNVKIAAGVRLITHDVIQSVFSSTGLQVEKDALFFMDKIVIGDNVMIGANAIINYGVEIGNNVIVAAGSVVTKNIPSGEIWGGNPAKKIGNFYQLYKKRLVLTKNRPTRYSSLNEINRYFFDK